MKRTLTFSFLAAMFMAGAAAGEQGIRTFFGELTSYRTCNVQDQGDKHVLGKFETTGGRIVILDLGPVSNLKEQQVRLERGMTMRASGRAGRLNDRPVVVVYHFSAGGRTTEIDRSKARASGERDARASDDDAPLSLRARGDERRSGAAERPKGKRNPDARQPQRRPPPGPGAAAVPLGAEQSSERARGEHEFEGSLLALRRIRLRGESEPHVLGRIEDDQGRVRIVDLGPVNKLRRDRVRPSQGDRIEGSGRSGRINGKPIVVVSSFNVRGDRASRPRLADEAEDRDERRHRTPRIDREQQRPAMTDRERDREQQRKGQLQIIRGEVEDSRDVTPKDGSSRHRLLKMKTSQGRTVIVDLGTGEPLKQIKLEKGDRVIVVGEPGRLNDRPVIKAQAIAEFINLQRQEKSLSQR